MREMLAPIVITALITVLSTLLVSSWATEKKFVLRCEYETLCKRLDRIDDKIDFMINTHIGAEYGKTKNSSKVGGLDAEIWPVHGE